MSGSRGISGQCERPVIQELYDTLHCLYLTISLVIVTFPCLLHPSLLPQRQTSDKHTFTFCCGGTKESASRRDESESKPQIFRLSFDVGQVGRTLKLSGLNNSRGEKLSRPLPVLLANFRYEYQKLNVAPLSRKIRTSEINKSGDSVNASF